VPAGFLASMRIGPGDLASSGEKKAEAKRVIVHQKHLVVDFNFSEEAGR